MVLVLSMICLALSATAAATADVMDKLPASLGQKIFPENFIFGVSTSSYQVEGGWLDGGKGFSIWDAYSHIPGRIANGDTGDVANDMFHLYPEDVKLMADYGIQHYRFSIAWNRIMPTGVAPVSQEGIDYYGALIDALLEHGIEPHVTIYHSETPLGLTLYPNDPMPFRDLDRFPGWFTDYAQVLFDNFGDRVKHWFTFNEPFCTAVYGTYGDTDPYLIAHGAILAHASVVNLYRAQYQEKQAGTIGLVLNTAHNYPRDATNPADVAAAQRGYDFWYGWFLDPLTTGVYPQSMRDTVGDRLPVFTAEQQKSIVGTLDFIAINYYFPYIASPGTAQLTDEPGFFKDMNVTQAFDPAWPLSQTGWGIYGPGLRDLLIYTQERYGIPTYVTENGLAWDAANAAEAVNDVERQQYLHDHIQAVGEAIAKGSDVRGYFVWSLQDNLEWASGFEMKFGLIWIERPSLERVVKNSMKYYSKIVQFVQKMVQ